MQSQRRAIKEVDIYGKIADKLLQLEPECCRADLTDEQQKLLISHNDGYVLKKPVRLFIDIVFYNHRNKK